VSVVRRDRRVHSRLRGGILFKLLVVLLAIVAVVGLIWMAFLPVVLTTQLRARTGFDATVDRFAINPFSGKILLRGLVVTNPPTFLEHDFIELREFQANADAFSLLSDRPVFDSMVIDVASVTLVKRDDGATNADVFDRNLSPEGAGPLPPGARKLRQFVVRRLTLRIDRLVIADHSHRKPKVREITLGINQTYTNVTDLKQLFAPAALQNLMPVAEMIGGLVPGDLGKLFGDAAKSGTDLLKGAGRTTGDGVKRFFDALEESKKP